LIYYTRVNVTVLQDTVAKHNTVDVGLQSNDLAYSNTLAYFYTWWAKKLDHC